MPAYLNCDEVDEGRNINMRSSGTMNSRYELLMSVCFYPRLDLSLISEVPCVKIQPINQFSVYLLHIPSLHYSTEIGLHVPGSLKEQFWTLLESRKAPGSLKVLRSLKVPYRTSFHSVPTSKPEYKGPSIG